MKELSIEGKAKAYDEALKVAQRLYNNSVAITKKGLEDIFPELNDSEDEKIRKSLVILLQHFCKGYRVPGLDFPVSYKDMLDWLEKQGEQSIKWNKNTEGNKPQKNHSVLIKTTHGIAEGEWNGGEHWIQYRWSGSIKDSDVLFWIELSDIEKQGEQKEATCVAEIIDRLSEKEQEILFKELDMQKEHNKFIESIQIGDQVTRNQDGMLVNLSQLKRVAKPSEKQGEQKPADKVEPKFKVGDIVKPKDGGHEPWQIMQVDMFDKKYRFKDGYVIHFSQEDDYELVEQKPAWSEEDEKMLSDIIKGLVHPWNEYIPVRIEDEIKWLKNRLKSLRPQNRWKPSDEQMRQLHKYCPDNMPLTNLYEQLKKLREE